MNPIQHVHIISHTHWDREWYLNSRFTNEWLVPFFESLFAMLDKEPHYRFVLDGQTSMIEDWFEQLRRHGHAITTFEERLRAYATAGRLLIGPYYLQPDWQLVSDEALVRNLLLGQATAHKFGPVMRAGWLLDNFGQISQAPQIHREFGIKGVYLWRGIEMDPLDIRTEFLWQGPDGTTVTAIYLAGSYRNGMRLAAFPEIMRPRIEMEVEKLGPLATSPNILIMNGYDQEMDPDDIVPPVESGLMDWDGVHVTQSTPEEYLDAVTAQPSSRPVLKGALYSGRYISVFPGILSSRMYLKTENDARQRQLEKVAEPLAAITWALGSLYPAEELKQCWKLLLKNHPHDSICGVSIDDVHTDMEVRFNELEALAGGLVQKALEAWVGRIDTTRGDAGACWVIVNTAPRPRDGIVALGTNVPLGFALKDAEGIPLPIQESAGGGTLVAVPAVPGLGYTTLYATPRDTETPARAEHWVNCNPELRTLENEYLHIRIHPDGSLTLTAKRDDATYPGLGVFEDGADAGDTYNYSPLRQEEVLTSKGRAAQIEFLETGPLRVTVRITHILPIPEELTPDRSRRSLQTRDLPIVTWLTLEAGSPVFRFHTRVHNTARDHRLRVLFPTGITTAVSQVQTQFDVVEHPLAPERYDDSSIPADIREILLGAREPEPATMFPQREFVDLSDGQRGVAVLNRGLPEYEVLQEKTTLALTLFRSVGWIARSDLSTRIGDAGPLVAVPEAQCLRTLDFHYALLPHAGDWETGRVSEWADEFNNDLLLVAAIGPHAGPLPDAGGFIRLEDGRGLLQVTAVKCSEDGRAFVMRFYNPSKADVDGYLRTFFNVERASYVTLDEREKAEIKIEDAHTVPVAAAPKAIVTVRLEITRQALPVADEPMPVTLYEEQQDESILQEYEAAAVVTAADVQAEQARADDLEKVLTQKQAALDRARAEGTPAHDLRSLYLSSQLQLDVETARRAYWEARLSATLLEKKMAETTAESADSEKDARSFDATLREIGLVLNRTRVSKRAWEYIVDCYRRLLAREGG